MILAKNMNFTGNSFNYYSIILQAISMLKFYNRLSIVIDVIQTNVLYCIEYNTILNQLHIMLDYI